MSHSPWSFGAITAALFVAVASGVVLKFVPDSTGDDPDPSPAQTAASASPLTTPEVETAVVDVSEEPVIDVSATPSLAEGSMQISGGCAAYQVFAQNRWEPYGAAIRSQPNILSEQVGSESGNKSLAVDGWVHSRAAYPTNPAPWNSDIWFHLADGSGWVSFAGVRAVPSSNDPTGQSADGGVPAPTPEECVAGLG